MYLQIFKKEKQITLCKVPSYVGVKGNEKADKATKQVIDIPGMTPQPDHPIQTTT